MALAQARIASIKDKYSQIDFAKAKEVSANKESTNPSLRHLRLTFDALDRLFALETKKDIYKINTETRTDGATNNAEAYLGDAYRNSFFAKQYLSMGAMTKPQGLEDQDIVGDLDKLQEVLKPGLNKDQKKHFADDDQVWNAFDTQLGFTRLNFEADHGEHTWIDMFNRTIRDQRFEFFDAPWFEASNMDFLRGAGPRDGIELYGFTGKELDLRPIGAFEPQALRDFVIALKEQLVKMPYLEKIYLDPKNIEELASLDTRGIPEGLLA